MDNNRIKDKYSKCGIVNDVDCYVCGIEVEINFYMFFRCKFSEYCL